MEGDGGRWRAMEGDGGLTAATLTPCLLLKNTTIGKIVNMPPPLQKEWLLVVQIEGCNTPAEED
jgi:hypothetical protein